MKVREDNYQRNNKVNSLKFVKYGIIKKLYDFDVSLFLLKGGDKDEIDTRASKKT